MASKRKGEADVEVIGLAGGLAALSALPQVAAADATRRANELAVDEADRIRAAAARRGRQARMAARSVESVRDAQEPAVTAAGRTIVRTGGRGAAVTGADVFYGSEFGGRGRSTTQQFPPYVGERGYWFNPTLTDDTPRIFEEWENTLDRLAAVWSSGRRL